MKLILMKTEVEIKNGLQLICLHHKFQMTPVAEFQVSRFKINYDMYFDHDKIDGHFENAVVNDMTMWPRTINPQAFSNSLKAINKFKSKDLRPMEIDIEKLSLQLQDYVASLPKQIIFGVKDIEKDSGVTLNQIFYYDGCTLKTPRWSSKCRTNIVNIRMDYF